MDPCAKSLLDGIIDYAGLFPPAELPMDEAFRRFVGHLSSEEGWMLARFVCPVSRLEELGPLLTDTDTPHPPITISALGHRGGTLEEYLATVGRESAKIVTFSTRHSGRAVVDTVEVGLPETGGVAVAVNQAWGRLTKNGSLQLTPFFEVSLLGDWRQRLPAAAAAVRDTDRKAGPQNRVGLKIRCGGLEEEAIPDVEAVAAAIATCRAIAVPLKATQGLHHPVRQHDPDLGATVHGFINLYAASVLAYVHDLPVRTLIEIVAEVDPGSFTVGPEHFAWHDYRASADEIVAARQTLLTTFGSCSFSEPRDDLKNLGIV
jgi:hypothetical protein